MLPASNKFTVTPGKPGSPASTTPLLFLSFHTKLPSATGRKKPKSARRLLFASGVVSVMPGVVPSPVGSPPTVNVTGLERIRYCTALSTNVVPTSVLFVSAAPSTSGVNTPSFGPVRLPLRPVLLSQNPAGNVLPSISTMNVF